MSALPLTSSEAEELIYLLATVAADVEYATRDEMIVAESFIERIEALSASTSPVRSLLLAWLHAEAALACEFFAVRPDDLDDLNAEARRRAAELGIEWDDELEAASREIT